MLLSSASIAITMLSTPSQTSVALLLIADQCHHNVGFLKPSPSSSTSFGSGSLLGSPEGSLLGSLEGCCLVTEFIAWFTRGCCSSPEGSLLSSPEGSLLGSPEGSLLSSPEGSPLGHPKVHRLAHQKVLRLALPTVHRGSPLAHRLDRFRCVIDGSVNAFYLWFYGSTAGSIRPTTIEVGIFILTHNS